jgi:hypothetical protein
LFLFWWFWRRFFTAAKTVLATKLLIAQQCFSGINPAN